MSSSTTDQSKRSKMFGRFKTTGTRVGHDGEGPPDSDLDAKHRNLHPTLEATNESNQPTRKKKTSAFSRLFRRVSSDHSSPSADGAEHTPSETTLSCAQQQQQQQADLELAHTLMTDPAEIATDLCRTDSETDLVHTICAPGYFSRDAIRADKKIDQIDVANKRITTLRHLSGTAVLGKDYRALDFLYENLTRLRKQRAVLLSELDAYLTLFKEDPSRILSLHASKQKSSDSGEPAQVVFSITDETGEDVDDLRWEVNSLSLSTDTTSADESSDDGLSPTQVEHLAKQIRKTEGSRFKNRRKISRHRKTSNSRDQPPPPPNPLGHTNRALMRAHTTVPSGLCQTARANNSSSAQSIQSLNPDELSANHQQQLQQHPHQSNQRLAARATTTATTNTKLPFNLLSLTGQLSWLVSEYVERDSPTHRWATELIEQISRMSVTRTTWLNVHQQLRETTELLYKHRANHKDSDGRCQSAQSQLVWNRLQAIHRSLADNSSLTVTANQSARLLLQQSSEEENKKNKLVPLSVLLEKKLNLAYICDLILWRAHKRLFTQLAEDPDAADMYQLTDFRIRHMQLRLDQANVQNWSPALIDWITNWIYAAVSAEQHVRKPEEDRFGLEELSTLRSSLKQFHVLVEHLRASEFVTWPDVIGSESEKGTAISRTESSESMYQQQHQQHQHPHCHPSLHHQGLTQDLRPIDADRCCHKYSILVRQVHEHALANRPLGYFAERALYDIAIELNCTVDWSRRLTDTLDELDRGYREWEQLLKARLDLDFYEALFPKSAEGR